ncbi:hypothetical protein M378DRAFT_15594 [Amanita muscaria Koide BX008]|uniref:Uncharacterized protein n=1 Tax=Amanita muscaria (strain Koide BX008) TaxID=946122 RepID=A0A0C2SW45_AMAMK|nr:hypothetical protein M378DRAFT_15594 [Amanita muscaria Koide BX008]
MDWNHQKNSTFLNTSNDSSIFNTVCREKKQNLLYHNCPRRRKRRRAVSQFSLPFTLEGLFGPADAGAFGEAPTDFQMDADEDKEKEAMQKDGLVQHQHPFFEERKEMTSDDLAPQIPCKRQHKRQRKSKDVSPYAAPPDEHVLKQMAKSNTLNRRASKRLNGSGMEVLWTLTSI